MCDMVNIVIPMAGLGKRFSTAGYLKPKPFIDVLGIPMIERVLINLRHPNAKYILIAQEKHLRENAKEVERIQSKFNCEFVEINENTNGSVETLLFSESLINNNNPLLIANSDQIVDIKISDFINDAIDNDLDGSILCFRDKTKNPKWSYAKINSSNLVEEVREKQPISDIATVGIYFFKQGKHFIRSAKAMIKANDTVNGEFYTCPTYNYLISENKHVGAYIISEKLMHGIGTPSDLDLFLKNHSHLDLANKS